MTKKPNSLPFGRNKDSIVSISAILIALAAFIVGVWDHIETRKHNRFSVSPVLVWVISTEENDCLLPFRGIAIENRGLGPAIIKPPLLFLGDEPIALLTPENADKIDASISNIPTRIFWGQVVNSLALNPGEVYEILRLQDPSDTKGIDWLKSTFDRLDIVIPYTSIYGDRVSATSLKGKPHNVYQYPRLMKEPEHKFMKMTSHNKN